MYVGMVIVWMLVVGFSMWWLVVLVLVFLCWRVLM